MEVWKDVIGFEGKYLVSNYGNVKSLPRSGTRKQEKILYNKVNDNGYLTVTLSRGKYKTGLETRVHKLVMQSFNPGNEEGLIINHIDGNKTNNRLENLEWVSQSYNANHYVQTIKNTGLKYSDMPIYGNLSERSKSRLIRMRERSDNIQIDSNLRSQTIIDERVTFIKSLNLDFSKYGWHKHLQEKLGIKGNVTRWIRVHCPELLV